MSLFDNPPLLSGQNAHGGIALFWKHAFDNYITPLTNTDSDRIVGIKCDFDNSSPLYISSVYLPTSSQKDIDFLEYFDHLTIYHSLSVKCYVILMGDFNGDLGEKSAREPNQRSLNLLELADYFNLCPINFWDYVMGLLIHLFLIVGDIVPHLITFSCPTVCSTKHTLLKRLI